MLLRAFTLFMLLLTPTLCAQEEAEAKPEPLDPKFVGEHEFVIVSKGTTLFASFLPSYKAPNNYQIIYAISTKNPELRYLVRDADLVTARSDRFNLQLLMRGQEVSTTLKVYIGHLQQGGMTVYESVPVDFDEKLYVRELSDMRDSSSLRIYDKVDINKTDTILVHQLQSAPSYDHLLLVKDMQSCITQFNTQSPIPSRNQVLMRFSNCGPIKPLYYNTQGFE